MNDEKKLKRDIRTIWDSLKHERRARSKMTGAAELVESAQRMASYGADLKELAKRAEALESTADTGQTPAAKTKGKRKAKPASKPE